MKCCFGNIHFAYFKMLEIQNKHTLKEKQWNKYWHWTVNPPALDVLLVYALLPAEMERLFMTPIFTPTHIPVQPQSKISWWWNSLKPHQTQRVFEARVTGATWRPPLYTLMAGSASCFSSLVLFCRAPLLHVARTDAHRRADWVAIPVKGVVNVVQARFRNDSSPHSLPCIRNQQLHPELHHRDETRFIFNHAKVRGDTNTGGFKWRCPQWPLGLIFITYCTLDQLDKQ